MKDSGKFKLSIEKLDKLMQNMGKGNFTYDLFKSAYDADPRLQKLVTNFDKLNIELKSNETDDVANIAGKPGRPGDTVGQMAKNAVDLKSL